MGHLPQIVGAPTIIIRCETETTTERCGDLCLGQPHIAISDQRGINEQRMKSHNAGFASTAPLGHPLHLFGA